MFQTINPSENIKTAQLSFQIGRNMLCSPQNTVQIGNTVAFSSHELDEMDLAIEIARVWLLSDQNSVNRRLGLEWHSGVPR